MSVLSRIKIDKFARFFWMKLLSQKFHKIWRTNTWNFYKFLCILKRSYHSVFGYPDGFFDVIFSLKSSDFRGLPNDIWLLSVVEKSTKKIYIFARIFVWNYWFFFVSKVPQNLTNKHFKIPHSFMCTETELSFGIWISRRLFRRLLWVDYH